MLPPDAPMIERGMDMLCSVPPTPGFALFGDLVKEFGALDQGECRQCIGLAAAHFEIELVSANEPGAGRKISINEKSWPKARNHLNAWWDKHYPDDGA